VSATRVRTTALGVGAVLAAFVLLLWLAPDDPDREGTVAVVGRAAPAIDATDTEGRPVRLADYRGQWLLVNFFATWCVPCRAEHPELVAFREAHRDAGDASVLSVAYDEEPAVIAEFFRTNGGDWPTIAEGADRYVLEYGVVKLPESFLIDPDGTVVHKFAGGVRAAEVDAVIERAARGRT